MWYLPQLPDTEWPYGHPSRENSSQLRKAKPLILTWPIQKNSLNSTTSLAEIGKIGKRKENPS